MKKQAIIDLLTKKAGVDVTTAAGSEWLCRDIAARTGENLGINTVKRFTGAAAEDVNPRQTTLDIISRYLGYRDWPEMKRAVYGNSSSRFKFPDRMIDARGVPVGGTVTLQWDPDRKIRIRHLRYAKYEVVEAENSKLQAGDILYLDKLMTRYPLFVRSVTRAGQELGPYTAAEEYGLTSVVIEEA